MPDLLCSYVYASIVHPLGDSPLADGWSCSTTWKEAGMLIPWRVVMSDVEKDVTKTSVRGRLYAEECSFEGAGQ